MAGPVISSEALKFSHLYDVTPDSNDPVADVKSAVTLLAKVLDATHAKLDADAGVTDTNYKALADATTL